MGMPTKTDQGSVPRNYSQPDPLNCGLEGKSVVITMVNGRTEAGTLKMLCQYFLKLEMTNKRDLIIAKSSIVTVSVL